MPRLRRLAPRHSRLCCAWRFMLRVCRLGCADRLPRPGEEAREDEADAGGRLRGSGGRPLGGGGGSTAWGACCCLGGWGPAKGAAWGGTGPWAGPGAPGIAFVVWGRAAPGCSWRQTRSSGLDVVPASWAAWWGAGGRLQALSHRHLKRVAGAGLLRCCDAGRCRDGNGRSCSDCERPTGGHSLNICEALLRVLHRPGNHPSAACRLLVELPVVCCRQQGRGSADTAAACYTPFAAKPSGGTRALPGTAHISSAHRSRTRCAGLRSPGVWGGCGFYSPLRPALRHQAAMSASGRRCSRGCTPRAPHAPAAAPSRPPPSRLVLASNLLPACLHLPACC